MFEMFVLSLSALSGNFDDSGVNYKVRKCEVFKFWVQFWDQFWDNSVDNLGNNLGENLENNFNGQFWK